MSEQQRASRGAPQRVSGAEIKATQKVAAAQQAVDRTFTSTLAKLALAGGAAYVLWHYMWQKSEEPLPEPASEAVSTDVLCSMLPLLPPGWR